MVKQLAHNELIVGSSPVQTKGPLVLLWKNIRFARGSGEFNSRRVHFFFWGGYSLIGKIVVFKIIVVGSNPTTPGFYF